MNVKFSLTKFSLFLDTTVILARLLLEMGISQMAPKFPSLPAVVPYGSCLGSRSPIQGHQNCLRSKDIPHLPNNRQLLRRLGLQLLKSLENMGLEKNALYEFSPSGMSQDQACQHSSKEWKDGHRSHP